MQKKVGGAEQLSVSCDVSSLPAIQWPLDETHRGSIRVPWGKRDLCWLRVGMVAGSVCACVYNRNRIFIEHLFHENLTVRSFTWHYNVSVL